MADDVFYCPCTERCLHGSYKFGKCVHEGKGKGRPAGKDLLLYIMQASAVVWRQYECTISASAGTWRLTKSLTLSNMLHASSNRVICDKLAATKADSASGKCLL